MTENKSRLQSIQNLIQDTKNHFGRSSEEVNLLAVSKTWPSEKLRELTQQGHKAFGENYLQEALQKMTELSDLNIEWHFIGPIQSNKTKDIAAHFAWVQSVDRLKIAKRLSEQRPESSPALNVCIQVNIDEEDTKSGVTAEEVLSLAAEIDTLPKLTLRGLMVIPSKQQEESAQRESFKRAHTLFVQLQQHYPQVDTLSMGMSNDMQAAIAEGSTMVRIGTALFGQRQPKSVDSH